VKKEQEERKERKKEEQEEEEREEGSMRSGPFCKMIAIYMQSINQSCNCNMTRF